MDKTHLLLLAIFWMLAAIACQLRKREDTAVILYWLSIVLVIVGANWPK